MTTMIETLIRERLGSEIYGFYQRINPIYGAARADFFRYLLMYAQGGIYLGAGCNPALSRKRIRKEGDEL